MLTTAARILYRRGPQHQHRLFTAATSSGPKKGGSNWIWPLATFAVGGGTFFFITNISKQRSAFFEDSYAKASPSDPQAEITRKAFMDFTIDDKPAGRIVYGLHGSVAPKTVQNFEQLCLGTQRVGNLQLAYKGSCFHRVIPGFMLQGGDFERHNGTGGKSIYGGRFSDETFELKHKVGVLSMANAGPNTNGSQFFITVKGTPHLNERHVVFGVVVDGWETVQAVEKCGSSSGRPSAVVRVVDCGLLDQNDQKE